VKEVMTPTEQVIMFNENQALTDVFLEEINEYGYSRHPIYRDTKDNVVGILYVKDLIVEDDDIAIKDTTEAFDTNCLFVTEEAYLDAVLARMLKKRQHLAIVRSKNKKILGVISLEDIIEEIIQQEIEDEDDEIE
jgi:CBS domain containing-hemolysin-like protein